MLLSIVITLPAILTRWVFLRRPIGKPLAFLIALSAWLMLLWMHHEGGGEGPPIFISLGAMLMYGVFVWPAKDDPAPDDAEPPAD